MGWLTTYSQARRERHHDLCKASREQQAKVNELEHKCQNSPDDLQLKDQLKDAKIVLLDFKGTEFAEREDKYPTDRTIKFQRGLIEFAREQYEDAMACFQASKEEPKLRVPSGHLLGQCFAAVGWHPEAVGDFKGRSRTARDDSI